MIIRGIKYFCESLEIQAPIKRLIDRKCSQKTNKKISSAKTAYKFFKDKPKNLIAVTGTNGKSSIAEFYFQILTLNKKK